MNSLNINYDVVVIGGGHAGVEAAAASARMGANCILITQTIETIGQMSCNPSIGGLGKSHLVAEVDVLGGLMGLSADKSGIHFRTLNASKGAAVRAKRAQCDRVLYRNAIQEGLQKLEKLTILQQGVDDLLFSDGKVVGVITNLGVTIGARSVILCTGTFLNGVIHIGHNQLKGGRAGEPSMVRLTNSLREAKLPVLRLKTGTPPRIDKRSVDFSVMTAQPSETPQPQISTWETVPHPKQMDCFITHTNKRTHDIIRDNLDLSALYGGAIKSVGPRYCPSIEDKIVRFSDRDKHQIFVEPEGLTSNEIYPNGISTSLPFSVQYDLVRSIVGFENAVITRPAYAIEYDYLDPTYLQSTLESRDIGGLFFAGQINGTTGYEEAAAQGLFAGVNATLAARQEGKWILGRHTSYIGVMVDDLVTRGVIEPYRMFTSRAEYRLLLREDNADQRLAKEAHALGLITQSQWEGYCVKMENLGKHKEVLKKTYIHPKTKQAETIMQSCGELINRETNLYNLLKRPKVNYQQIENICADLQIPEAIKSQLEIEIKYSGYIAKQIKEVEQIERDEEVRIPQSLSGESIGGISKEIEGLLQKYKPATLASFARLPGVTPAAVSIMRIYIKQSKDY